MNENINLCQILKFFCKKCGKVTRLPSWFKED